MVLFDVIEVQIKAPHETRVMAVDLTATEADAFIKFAIMRRGVENQFYKTTPAGEFRTGGPHPLEQMHRETGERA